MAAVKDYDVVIIGGSYAGLSAALTLVRSGKRTLVIDSDNSSNRPSPAAHNFITNEGKNPRDIRKKAKKELKEYPHFNFITAIASDLRKTTEGFTVHTIERKTFTAKKILFATGVSDIMPGIAGFADCWAKSILHCPYCHGYEVKDDRVAIIANGEHAYHLCVLLTALQKKITLFTGGSCTLSSGQVSQLERNGITIYEEHIKEIKHEGGQLSAICFMNGCVEKFNVAFAKVLLKQQCEIPEKTGCKFNEHLIAVDDCMRTSVEGVYAAGDNCFLPRSISLVVAAGTKAAFHINWDMSSKTFSER